MTLTPHPHLPRLPDPHRPSSALAANNYDLAARLLSLAEKHGGDAPGAPLAPVRVLPGTKLQRASLSRHSNRLSTRDDDHELASLFGFDIELQRCSVLVDPHCGNPKSLIPALVSVNDPFKIPRWSAVSILSVVPVSDLQPAGLFDARANFLSYWLLPLQGSHVDAPA